jgi:WD40 repeat protein
MLKPCQFFCKNGNCRNGNNCQFSHVVKLHAMIDASSPKQDSNNHQNNFNNNNRNKGPEVHEVTSVAIWETQGQVKIFTGSKDGFWRLWNFSGSAFVKEFEHNMGGSVECLVVASNFLFCGFESISPALPEVTVGMVHAWNLGSPNDPPLEFHMQPNLIPYAHARATTNILVVDGQKVVSGSRDGSIKLWTFDPASHHGKGGFVLAQALHGHAREITGLAVADTMLWSASTDGAIRIWDMAKNGECQHSITMASGAGNNPQALAGSPGAPGGTTGQGHTNAVTGLVPFTSSAGNFILSCSLDGTVKAWNAATGQCVASEGHGEGVVCMTMIADPNGKPCLLLGMESGNLWIRNLEPTPKINQAFAPLLLLSNYFSVAHTAAVRNVANGPAGTFYSASDDGKVLVFQITGDLGL